MLDLTSELPDLTPVILDVTSYTTHLINFSIGNMSSSLFHDSLLCALDMDSEMAKTIHKT